MAPRGHQLGSVPAAARWLTSVLLVGACSGAPGEPGADGPTVVAVEVQRCDRPTTFSAIGTVVGDDLVLTAAHTVDGDLRELTVDGRPAAVTALDARLDLALLAAPAPGRPARFGADVPAMVSIVRPAGRRDDPVAVTRTGTLVVDDATARVRHERQAHTIAGAVASGTSGAPVVDDEGRVVGVVVLADRRRDVSFAVTAAEAEQWLATVERSTESLAGLDPCA